MDRQQDIGRKTTTCVGLDRSGVQSNWRSPWLLLNCSPKVRADCSARRLRKSDEGLDQGQIEREQETADGQQHYQRATFLQRHRDHAWATKASIAPPATA
jgi:hypothetical protein